MAQPCAEVPYQVECPATSTVVRHQVATVGKTVDVDGGGFKSSTIMMLANRGIGGGNVGSVAVSSTRQHASPGNVQLCLYCSDAVVVRVELAAIFCLEWHSLRVFSRWWPRTLLTNGILKLARGAQRTRVLNTIGAFCAIYVGSVVAPLLSLPIRDLFPRLCSSSR